MSTFQSHRAQPPSTTPRSSRHAERAAGLTVVTAGWPPRHLPTHCLSPAPVFSIFFRVGCSLLLSSSRDFKHAPHRGGKFRSNRNGSGLLCVPFLGIVFWKTLPCKSIRSNGQPPAGNYPHPTLSGVRGVHLLCAVLQPDPNLPRAAGGHRRHRPVVPGRGAVLRGDLRHCSVKKFSRVGVHVLIVCLIMGKVQRSGMRVWKFRAV